MMSMYVMDREERDVGSSYAVERDVTGDMTAVRTRLMGVACAASWVPSIYPIYELLEHVKGLVLWNHSHRISMLGQQHDTQEESW